MAPTTWAALDDDVTGELPEEPASGRIGRRAAHVTGSRAVDPVSTG